MKILLLKKYNVNSIWVLDRPITKYNDKTKELRSDIQDHFTEPLGIDRNKFNPYNLSDADRKKIIKLLHSTGSAWTESDTCVNRKMSALYHGGKVDGVYSDSCAPLAYGVNKLYLPAPKKSMIE